MTWNSIDETTQDDIIKYLGVDFYSDIIKYRNKKMFIEVSSIIQEEIDREVVDRMVLIANKNGH